MKIKNIKDFVDRENLHEYISTRIKEWNNNTFGKKVEGFIVKSCIGIDGYKITKTTPEYDYIYGADFKVIFDKGHSCYYDLKITYKQDRLKDVETFLSNDMELDACYDERISIEVSTGTFMCLGVRYKRTLYQGTMVYDKPVLIPIIWGDISEEKITTKEVARNIRLLLAIGNQRLLEQGYDKTAKRSFTFIPKETIERG